MVLDPSIRIGIQYLWVELRDKMGARADVRPEQSQDLEDCIFNVTIDISGKLTLCVGLKYSGGNPNNHRNYRFDHANLWKDGFENPEMISMTVARRILRSRGLLLRDLPTYLE